MMINVSEKRDKRIIKAIEQVFGVYLYDYQKEIILAVFNDSVRKVTIKATTRAGKSWTLALAILFYTLTHSNRKSLIIATTQHKTKIIYSYIAEFLAMQPELVDMLDMDLPKNDIVRLKKETSKQKITFKNGSSIEVLTADLPGGGQGLMGFAANGIIACDESAEYSADVWPKVYRMLVDNPTSKLIEIYNPFFLNHTFEHWNDDSWYKIHIDWKKCVKQGRMTLEDVEDQRRNITELEFEVLFNANFPENIENSLFKKQYLDQACFVKEFKTYDKIHIGADIAAGGKDYTVITVVGESGNEFSYIEHKRLDTADTMNTVGEIQRIAERYTNPEIKIDAIGFGKGVIDRLKENNFNAYSYIAGESAVNRKRFYNRKSEDLFGLSEIMQQGRFYNLPANSPYILDSRKIIYEVRSDRLLKTIDPEDKSPDYLDSLNIALARPKGRFQMLDLVGL